MKNWLAKVVSGVFSPFVVIFVFGSWVIYHFSYGDFILWWAVFLLTIVLLPFSYAYVGVKSGKFSDIHIAVREHRLLPFTLATSGAILLSIFYFLAGAPSQLLLLATTLTICGIIFALISYYWKISIHMSAFAGAVTIVGMLISPVCFYLLLLCPVIAWSRLERERHSLPQTVAGALLVSAVVYLVLTKF